MTRHRARRGTSDHYRSGPDLRGSAATRRARKRWLLETYGDGETVACWLGCGAMLDYETLTVDRIVPGSEGGRYVRDNVMPACLPCNVARGDNDYVEHYKGELDDLAAALRDGSFRGAVMPTPV